MKKIIILFYLCLLSVSASMAQPYFTLSVSFTDVNGNPYQVDPQKGYGYVAYAAASSDSASNPYHFMGWAWFSGNSLSNDSVYYPTVRKDDSVTFTYLVCGVNGPEEQSITRYVASGSHVNLGTINTGCVPECDAQFYHSVTGNGNVDFYATANGFNLSYYWYFGDGKSSTSKDLRHTYMANGSYNVVLYITNPYGCTDSIKKTINITNALTCVAGFNYTVSTLNNGQVSFTNTSTTATSFFWDFGDGNTSTLQNPTHAYVQSGSYNVSLYMQNNGCYDSVAKNIYVAIACNPSFYWSQKDDSVQFNKYSTIDSTIRWIFGDGDSTDVQAPVHKYTSPGTYEVTLKIFSSNGSLCAVKSNQLEIFCNGLLTSVLIVGELIMDDTVRTGFGGVRFYLIELDTVNATLTAVDSMDVNSVAQYDSAHYYFNPCTTGNYYVKAALLPGATGYADFMPTYGFQSLYWSQANTVSGMFNYQSINMIRGNNPGGPGFIGGYISQGANKSGEALAGIEVLLLTESGDPVAYTYSTTGGRYEFSNIPLGKFKVLIEIPGKTSAVHNIELSSGNPSSDNNDFEVNKKDISTVIRFNLGAAQPLSLYPNPAKNTLHLELGDFSNQSGTLVVTDITGKEMMVITLEATGETIRQVDISSLGNGVYFIKGTLGEKDIYAKFITVK